MQEVVALMDILGHVLGDEEMAQSAVISIENTPFDYTLRVLHIITVDLESQPDDPGDLLTNLDPPLSSLNVLSFEIITVFPSTMLCINL